MAGSTSKITRPEYVTSFANNLLNQAKNANSDYVNLDYKGLSDSQQQALNQLMSGSDFNSYVDQLMQAGNAGTSALDNAYNKIQDLYSSGQATPEAIDKLTQQLYKQSDVDEGIRQANIASEAQYAEETNPAIAQQTLQQSGFGSGNALARRRAEKGLVAEEQSNANQIAQNAYAAASQQATNIFNANQQNTKSVLAGLTANAGALASGYGTAADLSQRSLQQGVQASQQSLQDRQNAMNVDYQNQVNQQNQMLTNLQNKINAASAANGVLGMTTKQTTSGGGTGLLGGFAGGAAAGAPLGPWGMLAGGVIGAAGASMSQ